VSRIKKFFEKKNIVTNKKLFWKKYSYNSLEKNKRKKIIQKIKKKIKIIFFQE
jgi:hypothetical protein